AWFALSTTGAVIASRRSANPIGWLYCAMGFLGALTTFAQQYAIRGLVDHPGSLPGTVYVAWLERWSLWFVFPAGIALVLFLFPTGRPASPRWQPLVWLSVAFALLMVVGSMFSPGEMTDALRSPSAPGADFGVVNPFGIGALGGALDLADSVGGMAAFITAVYVGIVVGIGNLVGTSGRPNLGLSILATALVAVVFEPVREGVQRVANRLVYGKRASPYEVLSHFSQRVADVYST